MNRLPHIVFALAAGVAGLALAGSAAGTTQHTVARQFGAPIDAIAVDGPRIAYDVSSRFVTKPGAINKVMVWNVATGRTVKVSGAKTAGADGSGTGAGVFDLAIAGTRVAWMTNVGGNLEGDDALLTSSVTRPKEHQVAAVQRTGQNCPGRNATRCGGPWLGGLAGSGDVLALNRWTTNASGEVTAGGLFLLDGTRLKTIATGAATVEAASASAGRVAVLRPDGTVGVYSSTGRLLHDISPTPAATEVSLNGTKLVVLRENGTAELYNAKTGAARKSLALHGVPAKIANLGVAGHIVVYTTNCAPGGVCPAGSVRALDLSTGKDAWIGTLKGGVEIARIGTAGLVYSGNGWHASYGKGKLVFVPYGKLVAAVS